MGASRCRIASRPSRAWRAPRSQQAQGIAGRVTSCPPSSSRSGVRRGPYAKATSVVPAHGREAALVASPDEIQPRNFGSVCRTDDVCADAAHRKGFTDPSQWPLGEEGRVIPSWRTYVRNRPPDVATVVVEGAGPQLSSALTASRWDSRPGCQLGTPSKSVCNRVPECPRQGRTRGLERDQRASARSPCTASGIPGRTRIQHVNSWTHTPSGG